MKKIKVLIIAGIFPPDIGGPASYVPALASALSSRGHDVTVLTFSDVKSWPADASYPFKLHRVPRKRFIVFREAEFVMKGIALGREADVVYANGNDFKAHLIARSLRVPTVHKIVGDTSWERAVNRGLYSKTIDEYQTESPGPVLRYFNWVRNFPLRRAGLIITPSKYLANLAGKWTARPPVKVIYNAYSHHAVPSVRDFPNKARTIVMIGRLVPWKGHEGVIRALTELEGLELMIMGDGPCKLQLIETAYRLGLQGRVHFMGSMQRPDIMAMIKGCYCLVINSSYEGLPHVALEAFEMKLPVIATNVGGNPEVVVDRVTGLLVELTDQADLVRALREVGTPSSRETLVHSASTLMSDAFQFGSMVDQTERALVDMALS